jgi:hypothetical protein
VNTHVDDATAVTVIAATTIFATIIAIILL